MVVDADELRRRATRYQHLARLSTDQRALAVLTEMARELRLRADRLDIRITAKADKRQAKLVSRCH